MGPAGRRLALLSLSTGAAALGSRAFPRGAIVTSECAAPRPEWIWCDDFDDDHLSRYFEYDSAQGRFVRREGVGIEGSGGMVAHWTKGQVSVGSLHLAFGRTPTLAVRPVDDGRRNYRDIYWRIYLRTDSGWSGGGGNKLSRAQILATAQWAQAMVAPVWSGEQPAERDYLLLDPASGTDPGGNLRVSRYNDQNNFRFLGSSLGRRPIFSTLSSNRWYCIEAHVKLNDPGRSNGTFEAWIDDQPEARKDGLNWVGLYTGYGVNTVFIENYWNRGSPRDQDRFFDRFVVSTARIGCAA
jgi:hypothetical protein